MSFAKLLTQRCAVQRMRRTADGIGGVDEDWGPHISDLPCLVQAASGTERAMSGSTGVAVTHNMFATAGADITELDRVVMDGTIYDIRFVDNVRDHHLEIALHSRRPNRG